MPLFRQIPKRGFSNAQFTARYAIVNLAELDAKFEVNAHVTPALMAEAGLIRSAKDPVKVLGGGSIGKKLKIEASKFSEAAAAKIKAAGGECREMSAT